MRGTGEGDRIGAAEAAGPAVIVARVCVLFTASKPGAAQPTRPHLQALSRAGMVTAKRIGQRTFYKRNEAGLTALKQKIAEEL